MDYFSLICILNFTKQIMEELIRDYQMGIPIKELERKYKMSSGSIYYYFKKLNIPKKGYTIHYNNPFIQYSHERDYWLGWLFSDGCIVNTPRYKYVYLACLDYDILLKFKDFCGNRAKLNSFKYTTPKSKEEKVMHKVVINSSELANYFKDTFGIANKKATTLNPNIELNWNILRGAYDGDGSFKKGVVITSMSKEWIYKICKFYDTHNLHYTLLYDTGYRLAIYKKEDIKKVFHYLYDNQTLYLQRKKEDLFRLAMR